MRPVDDLNLYCYVEYFSADPLLGHSFVENFPQHNGIRAVVRVTQIDPAQSIGPAFIHWTQAVAVVQEEATRTNTEKRVQILEAIGAFECAKNLSTRDDVIQYVLSLSGQEARDHLDILDKKGFIKLAEHLSGYNVRLTPEGRFKLKALLEKKMRKRSENKVVKGPDRIFISHGQNTDWLKVQPYIQKDIGIDTLELAQESFHGRTILQKLVEEADKCSFAVVVMTGDDKVGEDQVRARENVIHEIGFFQGKYGLERVCLLHEEGVNIPNNIKGLGFSPFQKGHIEASFVELRREIEAAFPYLKK